MKGAGVDKGITDKSATEASLDEVLSSIKDMVTGPEPPVLDLTDMIAEDGSVIKLEKNKVKSINNPDMKSFLRLIQENADVAFSDSQKNKTNHSDGKNIGDASGDSNKELAAIASDSESSAKLPGSRIETSVLLTSESLMNDREPDYRLFGDPDEDRLDSGKFRVNRAKNATAHPKSAACGCDVIHRHKIEKNDEAAISSALMNFISPMIVQWIKDNLPAIVGKIAEDEVKKILGGK
jgi:cell pole-organizing protein PopZ